MYRQLLIAVAYLLCTSQPAWSAVELITNGGFETGDFTGWTIANLAGGSGDWFVSTPGSPTPLSAQTTSAVGAGGLFYAVSDQNGPGTHGLSQTITLPGPAASVILSFDWFTNDISGLGPIVDPSGLDHTGAANQHARIDLLTAAAGPFDTGAGVLGNFYLGVDAGALPHDFTHYSLDITALVGAGGTFQLRFAEVDNQLFFNAGVDNVSVLFTPMHAVPEAASLATWSMLGGLGLAFGYLRRGR